MIMVLHTDSVLNPASSPSLNLYIDTLPQTIRHDRRYRAKAAEYSWFYQSLVLYLESSIGSLRLLYGCFAGYFTKRYPPASPRPTSKLYFITEPKALLLRCTKSVHDMSAHYGTYGGASTHCSPVISGKEHASMVLS